MKVAVILKCCLRVCVCLLMKAMSWRSWRRRTNRAGAKDVWTMASWVSTRPITWSRSESLSEDEPRPSGPVMTSRCQTSQQGVLFLSRNLLSERTSSHPSPNKYMIFSCAANVPQVLSCLLMWYSKLCLDSWTRRALCIPCIYSDRFFFLQSGCLYRVFHVEHDVSFQCEILKYVQPVVWTILFRDKWRWRWNYLHLTQTSKSPDVNQLLSPCGHRYLSVGKTTKVYCL